MLLLVRVSFVLLISLSGYTSLVFASADTLKEQTFKRDSIYIVRNIRFIGNKITRHPVIFRELAVEKDSIYSGDELHSKIQLSIRNLNNTQLFNSVECDIALSEANINLTFILNERWYIWPSPIFDINERNFNEWWEDKDLSRVSYGMFVQVNNFRGRNETLNSGFKYGFDQAVLLQHVIPYLDKKYRNGLAFTATYRRNHEMAYTLDNNKLIYFKDNVDFVRKQVNLSLKFTRRLGFYQRHIFELEAHDEQVADTITKLNPSYHGEAASNQHYLALSYFYSFDKRDDKNYPLEGYYTDFKIQKEGITGNGVDNLSLSTSLRWYKPMSRKFYFASGLRARAGSKLENPFSVVRFLGFANSLVRGYEPYVIPANDYIISRNNLRFNLLEKKIVHLSFIPFKQFHDIPNTLYLNLHCDMGWVSDFNLSSTNRFNEVLLAGYGLGLDYVTYYSLVMRFEYSINKLGERGFFVNFTAPI